MTHVPGTSTRNTVSYIYCISVIELLPQLIFKQFKFYFFFIALVLWANRDVETG